MDRLCRQKQGLFNGVAVRKVRRVGRQLPLYAPQHFGGSVEVFQHGPVLRSKSPDKGLQACLCYIRIITIAGCFKSPLIFTCAMQVRAEQFHNIP